MSDLYAMHKANPYDGLIAGVLPHVIAAPGTLAAQDAEATLMRGTILAKDSSTGKLSVLGTAGDTLKAYGILCDDTVVGTEDVNAMVYVSGCFDLDECTVAEGYTVTEADKDALRDGGILFKAVQDMASDAAADSEAGEEA